MSVYVLLIVPRSFGNDILVLTVPFAGTVIICVLRSPSFLPSALTGCSLNSTVMSEDVLFLSS